MINNDIYRRLRYLFGYQYDHVVALFASTGFEVNEAQYKGWAGTEEEDLLRRFSTFQPRAHNNSSVGAKM